MRNLFNDDVMSLDTYIMFKLKEETAKLTPELKAKNRTPISLAMGAPTANPPKMIIQRLKEILDEDGNATYKNADGSDYEGAEEDLVQQLEPYNNAEEYTNLENEMKDLLEDVEAGKYPLDENENGESVNVAEESVQPEDVTPTSETSIPDESNSVDELEKEKIKKGLL